jgi:hypothetical protein
MKKSHANQPAPPKSCRVTYQDNVNALIASEGSECGWLFTAIYHRAGSGVRARFSCAQLRVDPCQRPEIQLIVFPSAYFSFRGFFNSRKHFATAGGMGT